MLRVDMLNVTPKGETADGLADYRAYVKVNYTLIWHGMVSGHKRAEGAAALLRRLADAMEREGWSREATK